MLKRGVPPKDAEEFRVYVGSSICSGSGIRGRVRTHIGEINRSDKQYPQSAHYIGFGNTYADVVTNFRLTALRSHEEGQSFSGLVRRLQRPQAGCFPGCFRGNTVAGIYLSMRSKPVDEGVDA